MKVWDEWLKGSELWERMYDRLGDIGIPGVIGILVALSWSLAFAAAFLLDYGFRLEAAGDTLTIERGFLEKKRTVIALRRIQAVRITENALHKPFGMVAVRVVIAGSSDGEKKTADFFPLVRVSELPGLFETFLPDFRLPETWHSVDRKARAGYITLPVLLGLCIVAGVILLLPTVWSWCALVLPLMAWWEGNLRFRRAAWSREEGRLSIRFGGFSRHRVLILQSRIQWHRVSRNPLQEGKKLATFKVALASGKSGTGFVLRHASESDICMLSGWLSASAKRS
ncbi:PH domain-containing protein [Paenibacillus sp. P25]|nr:PH domain-containing protein [Paenibacillus sp. P25]